MKVASTGESCRALRWPGGGFHPDRKTVTGTQQAGGLRTGNSDYCIADKLMIVTRAVGPCGLQYRTLMSHLDMEQLSPHPLKQLSFSLHVNMDTDLSNL